MQLSGRPITSTGIDQGRRPLWQAVVGRSSAIARRRARPRSKARACRARTQTKELIDFARRHRYRREEVIAMIYRLQYRHETRDSCHQGKSELGWLWA